jgi:hypothetical protein
MIRMIIDIVYDEIKQIQNVVSESFPSGRLHESELEWAAFFTALFQLVGKDDVNFDTIFKPDFLDKLDKLTTQKKKETERQLISDIFWRGRRN